MSSFLLKAEAIESRIASYSCPRGIAGGIHSLRLRRIFGQRHRGQSTAAGGWPSTSKSEVRSEDPITQLESDVEASSNLDAGTRRKHELGRFGSTFNETLKSHPVKQRSSFGKSSFGYLSNKLHHIERRQEGGDKSSSQSLPIESLVGDAVLADFSHTAQNDGQALYKALQTGNPQSILRAVMGTIRHDGGQYVSEVLQQLPASTFSEVLRSIHPRHFVSRFNHLHKEISTAAAKNLGLILPGEVIYNQGYQHFCGILLSQISGITEARRKTQPLSLSDYKFILDSARVTGSKSVADYAWNELVQQGLKPDVDCYNSYMATKCLADTLHPSQRFKLRVTPDHLRQRANNKPLLSFRGHGVGPQTGIKVRITRIFNNMINSGVLGNEETFCMMMIALAREGDLSGVASVLKRVWNIDVHSLMHSSEDEGLIPPRNFTPDSPFHPSDMLLFTLAHAYSINGSIPTALRLVDYVSQNYSLDITPDVWNELLQWTYVLSTSRSASKTAGGRLPPEAVSNLWATMTSEPYNVKPSIQMYDRLIENLINRQRFREAEYWMEEARQLYKSDVRRLMQNMNVLSRRLSKDGTFRSDQESRNVGYLKLRNRVNRLYIRRWVRRFIKESNKSLESSNTWKTQVLPAFFKRWDLFLPYRLEYRVPSGKVHFRTGSAETNAARIARFERLQSVQRVL